MKSTKYIVLYILINVLLPSNVLSKSFDLQVGTIELPKGFVLINQKSTEENDLVFEFYKKDNKSKLKTYISISAYNHKNHNLNLSQKGEEENLLNYLKDAITAHRKKHPSTSVTNPRKMFISNRLAANAFINNLDGLKSYNSIISCTIIDDHVLTFSIIESTFVEPPQLFKLMKNIENFKSSNNR